MLNKTVNRLFLVSLIVVLLLYSFLFVGFLFNFDVVNLKIVLRYSLYPLVSTFILCLLFGFKN